MQIRFLNILKLIKLFGINKNLLAFPISLCYNTYTRSLYLRANSFSLPGAKIFFLFSARRIIKNIVKIQDLVHLNKVLFLFSFSLISLQKRRSRRRRKCPCSFTFHSFFFLFRKFLFLSFFREEKIIFLISFLFFEEEKEGKGRRKRKKKIALF